MPAGADRAAMPSRMTVLPARHPGKAGHQECGLSPLTMSVHDDREPNLETAPAPTFLSVLEGVAGGAQAQGFEALLLGLGSRDQLIELPG
jgi:hypothetical protein